MSISISNSSNILHTEDNVKNLITFSHTFTLSNGQKISTQLTYNSKDVKDIEKFKETLLPTITKTVEITISYGLGVKADKFVIEGNKFSRFKDGTKVGFKGVEEKTLEYKTEKDLDDFLTAKKQKLETAPAEKADKKDRLTFIDTIRKFTDKLVEKPAEKPAHIPVEKPSDESIADLKHTIQNISKAGFVAFYKNGPTAFLGNFAPCNIQIFEHTFKCSEAAFQWRKYQLAAKHNKNEALEKDPALQKFFTATGEEAFQLHKALEKKYPGVYVPNWRNGRRDKVMWDVLHAKFDQNAHLMELLKATGTAYLLEHNQVKGRDDYWSDNHDGSGANMLGKMLAGVRNNGKMPKNDQADRDSIEKFAKMYAHQGYKIF